MNKIELIGRLTKDTELKTTTAGGAVTYFSIAVDRRAKDQNADFFDCVAFGKMAEFITKFFSKGMRIAIAGRMQNNNYTDKNGTTHYGFNVIVEEAEFCERKAAATDPQPQLQQVEQQPSKPTLDDVNFKEFENVEDDIPF